jgi:hypothetical protein
MQIWSFHNGDLDFGFELRIVATCSLLDGYQLFGENYRLQGCYHLQRYYTSSAQMFRKSKSCLKIVGVRRVISNIGPMDIRRSCSKFSGHG